MKAEGIEHAHLLDSAGSYWSADAPIRTTRVYRPPGMEPIQPRDPADHWIETLVKGRSFVDIGGIGMDSVNERVTFAVNQGAASATMADIRPSSYYEWDIFDQRCAERGIQGVERLDCIDINSPELPKILPQHDIVFSTGIFYHLANPVLGFDNLRKVVGRYLITNTVTVPEVIENRHGRLTFQGNGALFLPGISERERAILGHHYHAHFGLELEHIVPRVGEGQNEAVMPYLENDRPSCWPYWWLMTDSAFRSLVRVMGFRLLREWKWQDHALFVLAEKL